MTRPATQAEQSDHDRDLRKHDRPAPLFVTTDIAFHWGKRLSAHTTGTIGSPLILTISGEDTECQTNQATVTIFTADDVLTARLISAINGVC